MAHAHATHTLDGGDLALGEAGSRYVVLAGRLLFSLIFIAAAPGHFSSQMIAMAGQHGVPLAALVVPLSGLLSLAGGLGVALGYRARLAAWMLVAFLVPVTFTMHNFWSVSDPLMHTMQMVMFMKNLALVGAALLIARFGAGPLSLDERRAAR